MLFWEALQCNKRFRSFIIDSNRSHDFIILCIFYAAEYRNDASKQGLVRMCIFVLQTMSVEPNFGKSLNLKFAAQDTLPQSIRLPNFRGSYADYLIMVRLLNFILVDTGLLTPIVHSYPYDHKERKVGRRLSCSFGNHEQCSPIRRAPVGCHLLENSTAVRINVHTQFPVSQRDKP